MLQTSDDFKVGGVIHGNLSKMLSARKGKKWWKVTSYGIVKNNKTGNHTYMKMGELGIGLSLGAKDSCAIFIFHNKDTMRYWVYILQNETTGYAVSASGGPGCHFQGPNLEFPSLQNTADLLMN